MTISDGRLAVGRGYVDDPWLDCLTVLSDDGGKIARALSETSKARFRSRRLVDDDEDGRR
jgi:hypothetical protein